MNLPLINSLKLLPRSTIRALLSESTFAYVMNLVINKRLRKMKVSLSPLPAHLSSKRLALLRTIPSAKGAAKSRLKFVKRDRINSRII